MTYGMTKSKLKEHNTPLYNIIHLAIIKTKTAQYTSLQYHKFGNNVGRLLVNLIWEQHKPLHIPTITSNAGITTSDPDQINQIFHAYYTKLYGKEDFQTEADEIFLSNIQLPSLTKEQLSDLNAPITIEEITQTITNLKSRKSPGPDGYTPEFYKTFKEPLKDTPESLYKHIWDSGEYMITGKESYIKLIHKTGKNPTCPTSY